MYVRQVGQLIALSQDVLDIVPEGLFQLLSAILEVPWVARAHVRSLEVIDKYFFRIGPALDVVKSQIL